MHMHWTQARWRQWRWRQRPLDWHERLALTVLAVAAIPIVLILFAALFLFAVGLGTVALAGWLAASLLRARRAQPPAASVITTEYRRLSEEREGPTGRNPWNRP